MPITQGRVSNVESALDSSCASSSGNGHGSAGSGGEEGIGGGRGGEGSGHQPADGQKTHVCYGLTIFTQAMLESKKMPVRAVCIIQSKASAAKHAPARL